MVRIMFTGRVRSFGYDPTTDKDDNVLTDEPTKMNYITIEFHAPEDEFSELGADDDPLMLKKPHATIYLNNITIPTIRDGKMKVYGAAKITVELEEV